MIRSRRVSRSRRSPGTEWYFKDTEENEGVKTSRGAGAGTAAGGGGAEGVRFILREDGASRGGSADIYPETKDASHGGSAANARNARSKPRRLCCGVFAGIRRASREGSATRVPVQRKRDRDQTG